MKVRPKIKFVRSLIGKAAHHNAVGFRADEKNRVMRAPGNAAFLETIHVPLYDADIDEAGVMQFWAKQPFDLQLKSHEGNCELCFMKSRRKINAIIRADPNAADWWVGMEDEAMASDRPSPFRQRRPLYRDMAQAVRDGVATDFGEFDEEMSCASHGCTD